MSEHDHDDLYALIGRLEQRCDDLDRQVMYLQDRVRDVGYTADDAKRAADDARNSAQRGW